MVYLGATTSAGSEGCTSGPDGGLHPGAVRLGRHFRAEMVGSMRTPWRGWARSFGLVRRGDTDADADGAHDPHEHEHPPCRSRSLRGHVDVSPYVLGTNIASAALRGDADLDPRLERLDPATWCIFGCHSSSATLRPRAQACGRAPGTPGRSISSTRCSVAPWDSAAADAHGISRAELKRHGTPIGAYDEMIAAHAIALGAVMVTDNVKHGECVPGLKLENWLRHGNKH